MARVWRTRIHATRKEIPHMTTITQQRPAQQRPAQQRQARQRSAQQGQAKPRAAQVADGPPVAVSGILDVGDSHAFVRTRGYVAGPADVYLTLAQVREYGLRKGDHVAGIATPGGQGRGREKFGALVRLDAVNGLEPSQAKARPDFRELTPLYPQQRPRLQPASGSPTARIIDLVSPIGKGQRGLIAAPPKTGQPMVLQPIAAARPAHHPDSAPMRGPW